MVPQTMDEWKMLLQLSQQCSNSRPSDHIPTPAPSPSPAPAPSPAPSPAPTPSSAPALSLALASNGTSPSLTNGGSAADHIQTEVTPENLVLRLARAVGPDRALGALQEVGMQSDMELGPHSTLVCELLRVAEKRQRWVMDHTRDCDTRDCDTRYQGL